MFPTFHILNRRAPQMSSMEDHHNIILVISLLNVRVDINSMNLIVSMESVVTFMIVLLIKLIPQIKHGVIC